jgi:anti-sigma regulatory factor (Ser/Thr protein kinase)
MFDADGLYELRATLAAHASHLGVPAQEIEVLVIIGSELATNAVRHGGGAGHLRLWHDATTLYCQITDEGPGIADPAVGTTLPAPASIGGRGIWICRHLAQDLIIELGRGGRGASVTAVISASPPPS